MMSHINKSGLPFSLHSSLRSIRWLSRNRHWSNGPKHCLRHLFLIKVTISFSSLQPPTSTPQSKQSSQSETLEMHSSQIKPHSCSLTSPLPETPFPFLCSKVFSFPMAQGCLWSLQETSPAAHIKYPRESLGTP